MFPLIIVNYSEFISTLGKLKNMPGHGGNRKYDLCFAISVCTQAFMLFIQLRIQSSELFSLPDDLCDKVQEEEEEKKEYGGEHSD